MKSWEVGRNSYMGKNELGNCSGAVHLSAFASPVFQHSSEGWIITSV